MLLLCYLALPAYRRDAGGRGPGCTRDAVWQLQLHQRRVRRQREALLPSLPRPKPLVHVRMQDLDASLGLNFSNACVHVYVHVWVF